jgi:hypothetical protein
MKILVISIQSHGHLNMCIGLCQELKNRGHRICFAVTPLWKGKLIEFGFDEILYEPQDEKGNQQEKLEQFACSMTEKQSGGDEFRIRHFAEYLYEFVGFAEKLDVLYEELVNDYKPDIILSDDATLMPYLERAGKRKLSCDSKSLFVSCPDRTDCFVRKPSGQRNSVGSY